MMEMVLKLNSYRYTKSKSSDKVYGIVLDWPATNKIVLGAPKVCGGTTIGFLGYTGGPLTVSGMHLEDHKLDVSKYLVDPPGYKTKSSFMTTCIRHNYINQLKLIFVVFAV